MAKFRVKIGLNELDLGLSLRYQINPKIAPYLGINWEHKFAQSADFAKKEGEKIDIVIPIKIKTVEK